MLEISDAQFSFLESVATEKDVNKALDLQVVSNEMKDQWKDDKDFWNSALAIADQLQKAHILNLAYIKDQLLTTIEGTRASTKIQIAAINASIKLLTGGGAGIRTAKAIVTPDSFSVSFEESQLTPSDGGTYTPIAETNESRQPDGPTEIK